DATQISRTQQTTKFFYIFSEKFLQADTNGITTIIDPLLPGQNKMQTMLATNGKELFPVSVTDNRYFCCQIKNKRLITKFTFPNVDYIQNVSLANNYFWFCTPKGVYVYNENGTSLNNNLPLFKDQGISCVLKDREGNYWFSTTGQGLLFVPDLSTTLLKTSYKPFKAVVHDSVLLLGTRNDELFNLNLNTLRSALRYEGHSNKEVYDLEYDTVTRTVLYTSRTFVTLNEKGETTFKKTIAIKDIQRIDNKYYAYTASGLAGLIAFNKKETSAWDALPASAKHSPDEPLYIDIVNGVRGKSVSYIKETNTIYFATSAGLFAVTPEKTEELKFKNKSIYLLKLQQYKTEVFGSNAQGIIYEIKKGGAVLHSGFNKVLLNETVVNIKIAEHYLFILTKNNLFFLDLDDAGRVLNKVNVNVQFTEISDICIYNKKLILCSDAGLLFLDFEKNNRPFTAARLIINSFKVNTQKIKYEGPVELKYNENNIEINYSVLSFKTEFKFPLFYKVNGNEWELLSAESRTLKLVALSPDDYTISFRLGEESKTAAEIKFTIKKAWWTEYWFLALCFLLVLAIVYSYYKWQLSLLRKRNALLSEKIDLEKNLNSSILTSIKSQMNPHFFYNALNTIQSFIFTDDKKNAGIYLSKFSKLTRMILEHSEKEKISLNEEVAALTLYLEIEKVRFNDDFEFSIVTSDKLDRELIKIPSMLVQPYVENAIKHGLLHKKEKKNLLISFKAEENNLIISIDDNGIGRKRSEELNKIKQGKHQSFSTNANQLRLEILNKGKSGKTIVKYTDKMDAKNNPEGTTVIISVPIK
ncbi:MAG: histidine kinase, partial [Bacteroidia bacterium]|nr:histidine kinase [Bacteroidia bacterium]